MSGLLFFFCSDFREEIFALFFFCSDFPKDAPLEFPRREDTSKIEIGSCKIWNLNPPHFLPLENFLPVLGIEPRSALPIMSLMHLLQSSIDADMKIR